MLEESGKLNRAVEGLASNEELLRRAQQNLGLTRPELAVLLSTSQDAAAGGDRGRQLHRRSDARGRAARRLPAAAAERAQASAPRPSLKKEIIATKVANRFVNRLGIIAPFSLTEEEGASFNQAAAAFLAAERLFDMDSLWTELDQADVPRRCASLCSPAPPPRCRCTSPICCASPRRT
jgi:glutamate dehydrogenase